MKCLLLVGPGENQRVLAHRLHTAAPLAHIARIALAPSKSSRKWGRSLVSLTLASGLRNAWNGLMHHYARFEPGWPETAMSEHQGVNNPSVTALIEQLQPDLVLVSGTDLLRAPLIEAVGRHGQILNLHTGISPFIKGAPNCTNWALALGEFGMIGNTVMWIDAGIDSGPIVATEQTPLDGNESLLQLHIKVMDHAHDLLVRAYLRFCEGKPLPRIAQSSLGDGRLFLSRHWNVAAMIKAVWNFRTRYGRKALSRCAAPRLVSLEGA